MHVENMKHENMRGRDVGLRGKCVSAGPLLVYFFLNRGVGYRASRQDSPLDWFPKLKHSTARKSASPERVAMERSRQGRSENASFSVEITLTELENRPGGCVILCHLRFCLAPWMASPVKVV